MAKKRYRLEPQSQKKVHYLNRKNRYSSTSIVERVIHGIAAVLSKRPLHVWTTVVFYFRCTYNICFIFGDVRTWRSPESAQSGLRKKRGMPPYRGTAVPTFRRDSYTSSCMPHPKIGVEDKLYAQSDEKTVLQSPVIQEWKKLQCLVAH